MENSSTEYKREFTDGFEKEAVAFLNTIGGEILVGVDNDGNVVGLENTDKTALMITYRLKNNILPAVLGIFNVDVKTVGGKSYVAVTLAGGLEKPYYLKKYGMTLK